MTREGILAGIRFQIGRIENSIRAFDAKKITYEEAKQVSAEADVIIEKLRAVYIDTFPLLWPDTIPFSTRRTSCDFDNLIEREVAHCDSASSDRAVVIQWAPSRDI
jgi:hypothetical protein